MEEVWKDVLWYKWIYKISNLWRVNSLPKKWKWGHNWKILKPYTDKLFYKKIVLINKVKFRKNFSVHRLVWQAFLWLDINNPKICVCHKDDNPSNNKVENLFLWTHWDNMRDMINKWRRLNCNFNRKWKYHHSSKEVYQYDLKWNLIKKWDSMVEAEIKIGVFQSWISRCCRWDIKTSWWYKWCYNLLD